jgi:hypothetical protein
MMQRLWIPLFAAGTTLAASALPALGQAAVATRFSVGNVTSGVSMAVHAAASADRRYVIMNVHPVLSTIDSIDTLAIPNQVYTLGNTNGVNGAANAVTGSITIINQDPKLLYTPAPALKADHAGFAATMQSLAAKSRANIVLSYAALKEAGIDTAAPLSVDLPAQSLRNSLIALVRAAAPDKHIVITASDNVIFITSQKQDDNTIVTRWYDLGAVLGAIPRFVPKGTNLQATGNGNMSVAQLIMQTVRPDVWKPNGGRGEIDIVGSQVRIKAPPSVQAMLQIPPHQATSGTPAPSRYVDYGSN